LRDFFHYFVDGQWSLHWVEASLFLFVFGVGVTIAWAVRSSQLENWPTVIGSVQNRYIKPELREQAHVFSSIPLPQQVYRAVVVSYYSILGEQYTNREEVEFDSPQLARAYTERFPDSILIHYNPKHPDQSVVDADEQSGNR